MIAPTSSPRSTRDILVVDDTDANLTAFEAALSSLGCTLVLARSGAEALRRILQQDFALILLDVQMPGMDGYECARLIRSRERSRDVPIIFITAFSRDESEVMRAYELGAVDFLFKPVHPEVLRAKAGVLLQLLEARDARAQRQTAEELASLNAQLALADKRKDEFLAILAHELRNPLAPIETALELARRHPDEPLPSRIREILERQTRHLTRLVDDLLDLSRITANKLELRTSALRLSDVVDEALIAAQPLIEAQRHQLVIEPHGGEPLLVYGDRVRLVQVVVNLLNNAARYTAAGGRIELTYGDRDDRAAFVRVSDNGRGISPGVLERVFEMFVQERAGSDGDGGLGLGLALVRRLVELHGGSVSATSPGVGQGSTFEVRLPLAPVGTTADAAEISSELPAGGRSLRTVVVDDNPDLREMVGELLTELGHTVVLAADGPSGLALIREQKPDVALIDIGLPGMDGFSVARALRADAPSSPLRLIAMTGYGQHEDRTRALDAGFDVHLIKPATADAIVRALGE